MSLPYSESVCPWRNELHNTLLWSYKANDQQPGAFHSLPYLPLR